MHFNFDTHFYFIYLGEEDEEMETEQNEEQNQEEKGEESQAESDQEKQDGEDNASENERKGLFALQSFLVKLLENLLSASLVNTNDRFFHSLRFENCCDN